MTDTLTYSSEPHRHGDLPWWRRRWHVRVYASISSRWTDGRDVWAWTRAGARQAAARAADHMRRGDGA